MAVRRIETKTKYVIAHDSIITFENEVLKIRFDADSNQIRSEIDGKNSLGLDELKIDIIFTPGGEQQLINSKLEGDVLVLEITKSESITLLTSGLSQPLIIGNQGGKDVYLNLIFSKVNNSFLVNYTVYIDR